MCCTSLDCKTWVCKVCYDIYDDNDNEVHHVEVINDVFVEEYMNVDSDDESYESCDDAEEESDGSEKSIVMNMKVMNLTMML